MCLYRDTGGRTRNQRPCSHAPRGTATQALFEHVPRRMLGVWSSLACRAGRSGRQGRGPLAAAVLRARQHPLRDVQPLGVWETTPAAVHHPATTPYLKEVRMYMHGDVTIEEMTHEQARALFHTLPPQE